MNTENSCVYLMRSSQERCESVVVESRDIWGGFSGRYDTKTISRIELQGLSFQKYVRVYI